MRAELLEYHDGMTYSATPSHAALRATPDFSRGEFTVVVLASGSPEQCRDAIKRDEGRAQSDFCSRAIIRIPAGEDAAWRLHAPAAVMAMNEWWNLMALHGVFGDNFRPFMALCPKCSEAGATAKHQSRCSFDERTGAKVLSRVTCASCQVTFPVSGAVGT